jgi:hypothetical protein
MNTGFQIDSNTNAALLGLKDYFGVKHNSDVIKRALALAQVCAESASDEGEVTFVDKIRHREITVKCR